MVLSAAFTYTVIAGLCGLSEQTNPSADFWQQSEHQRDSGHTRDVLFRVTAVLNNVRS